MVLLRLFDGHNYPVHDTRPTFKFLDYTTLFARAAAWFADKSWPRRGVDLDGFLDGGPWQPMDAFYTCHYEHCLTHIVYEASYVNHSREQCARDAHFQRGERQAVSPHCQKHKPPCLLQVPLRPKCYSSLHKLMKSLARCADSCRKVSPPILCLTSSQRSTPASSAASTSLLPVSYDRNKSTLQLS